jgi:excisionase family DNA binding protein
MSDAPGEEIGAAPARLTMSVVDAGRRLGLRRDAAYRAVHAGVIPVIRIGRRMHVPIAAFERMLDVRSRQQIVAEELLRRLQADGVEGERHG